MLERLHRPFAAGITFLTVLMIPVPARAGIIGIPPTVCSTFERSDVVFRGRVVSVERIVVPAPPVPASPAAADGAGSHVIDGDTVRDLALNGLKYLDLLGTQKAPGLRITFEVLEAFRGSPAVRVGARVTVASAEWSPGFVQGHVYVVFATAGTPDGGLVTTVYSHDREVKDEAHDEDLAWLRGYATSDSSGYLFGEFLMRDAEEQSVSERRMLSIHVTGDGVDRTVLAEHARYRMDKLPPGTYTVAAILPPGVVTVGDTPLEGQTPEINPQKVELAAKGCSEVDWELYNDSHVTGRVTDASGAPVRHAQVALARRDKDSPGGFSTSDSSFTDADGRYDIARAAPGKYLVVLLSRGPDVHGPHHMVFYPGVQNLADAETVTIGRSGKAQVDLVAAPTLVRATVHVKVLQQDGTPLGNARFDVTDLSSPGSFRSDASDATGSAELALLAGDKYAIRVRIPDSNDPCGRTVSFVARDGMTLAPMSLNKSLNACHAAEEARLAKYCRKYCGKECRAQKKPVVVAQVSSSEAH